MAKLYNPETCIDLASVASQPDAAAFRAYSGIGTANSPENLNDNNTANLVGFDTANKYVEVLYGDVVKIKRWRQFGSSSNSGNERFKIQYWDIETDAWVDWVVNVVLRNTNDWSGFTTEVEKVTTKIKFIMTTISGPSNEIKELEVIY